MVTAGDIAIFLGQTYTTQLVWGDQDALENDTITVFLYKTTEPPVAIIQMNHVVPHVTIYPMTAYGHAGLTGVMGMPSQTILLQDDKDKDRSKDDILKEIRAAIQGSAKRMIN